MIKAIIFDWGGVLLDDPELDLVAYCANNLGITPHLLKENLSKYNSDFQKGLILEKELWKNICNKLNIKEPTCKSLWKDAVKNVFNDKKEVYQLANSLRKKGYKVGVLSNTEVPTMEYFHEQKYNQHFDVTIFSCAEKTSKPEARIYHIALEKLNVKLEETIFIDDKPTYIEGAIRVGIKGIVFKDITQLKKELVKFSVKI